MTQLLLLLIMMLSGIALGRAFPEYYDIADHAAAEAEANQRHLPLAWLGEDPADLKTPEMQSVNADAEATEGADLTQMALSTLQNQAVVICFNGHDMTPVPAIVHAQDHIADDGPLAGGASWMTPKIVFTNFQVSRILGRVSHTEMAVGRQMPITAALQKIAQDPAALVTDPVIPAMGAPTIDPDSSTPSPNTSGTTTSTSSSNLANLIASLDIGDPSDDGADDMSADELAVWSWWIHNGTYVGIGVGLVLLALRSASRPAA